MFNLSINWGAVGLAVTVGVLAFVFASWSDLISDVSEVVGFFQPGSRQGFVRTDRASRLKSVFLWFQRKRSIAAALCRQK